MFFDEQTERKILHDSTSKLPYDNKPIVKQPLLKASGMMKPPPRAIGGSRKSKKEDNGVATLKPPKLLYSSSMSGGAKPKRKLTAYQELLKKVREEKGLSLKDAMKHVKDNNLY